MPEEEAPAPPYTLVDSAAIARSTLDELAFEVCYIRTFSPMRSNCASGDAPDLPSEECFTEFAGGCAEVGVTSQSRSRRRSLHIGGSTFRLDPDEPILVRAVRAGEDPVPLSRECEAPFYGADFRIYTSMEACWSGLESLRCSGRGCRLPGTVDLGSCDDAERDVAGFAFERLDEEHPEIGIAETMRMLSSPAPEVDVWELVREGHAQVCVQGVMTGQQEGEEEGGGLLLFSNRVGECDYRDMTSVRLDPYRYRAERFSRVRQSNCHETDVWTPSAGPLTRDANGVFGVDESFTELSMATQFFSFDGRWFFLDDETCQRWATEDYRSETGTNADSCCRE